MPMTKEKMVLGFLCCCCRHHRRVHPLEQMTNVSVLVERHAPAEDLQVGLYNNLRFNYKLTERSMFTNTALPDDHKLQESNLTAQQPRRVPSAIYISFNERRRLANEGLANHTGMRTRTRLSFHREGQREV